MANNCPPVAGFAFFDFDKTLIADDIGPLYGWYLFQRHERTMEEDGVGKRERLATRAKYASFLAWVGLQTGLYKARAMRRSQIIRAAYKGLKGVPVDHYFEKLDPFVDERIPDLIYPDLLKEIKEHQAAGRPCIIITTGLTEVVRRCLRHFPPGIEVIGCDMRVKDGRLTGEVDGPLYGADKANILRAYCLARGVDPADCWAYSDHYSDKHMLEAVGHGVCVNPRSRLLELATLRGWRVIRPTTAGQQTEGPDVVAPT